MKIGDTFKNKYMDNLFFLWYIGNIKWKRKDRYEEETLNTFDLQTKSGKKIELEYFKFEDGEFYLKLPKNFQQLALTAPKNCKKNGKK